MTVIDLRLCLCGCEQPLTGRRRSYATDECQKRAARAARLDSTFNITVEEYDRILTEQHGGCGICGKPPKPGKRLAVDHDHQTGYVRGLLDFYCNKRVLGARNAETLIRTAAYVTDPPAWRIIGKRVAPGRPPNRRKKRSTTATRKPRRRFA